MSNLSSARIQFYQRQHKQFLITVTNSEAVNDDEDSSGYNPLGVINLTGHSLRATIKKKRTDADPAIVEKTTADSAEIEILTQTALPWDENSTRGQARLYFVPDDTDPVNNTVLAGLRKQAGQFVMDVWMTTPTGEQKLILLLDIDIIDVPTDTLP